MNDEIQLEDFKISLFALWKKKLLIISATILSTLIGLLFTYNDQVVNTFIAKTSIYNLSYATTQDKSNAILLSFSDIITSKKVCERAASLIDGGETLDADSIRGMLIVNAINNSVIEIDALSTDPELAVAVANAVAEAFVKEVTSSTKNDGIQILDAADRYSLYSSGSNDLISKRGIFTLLGIVISSVYIVFAELSSKKLRTVTQCIYKDDDVILGIVPYIK